MADFYKLISRYRENRPEPNTWQSLPPGVCPYLAPRHPSVVYFLKNNRFFSSKCKVPIAIPTTLN